MRYDFLHEYRVASCVPSQSVIVHCVDDTEAVRLARQLLSVSGDLWSIWIERLSEDGATKMHPVTRVVRDTSRAVGIPMHEPLQSERPLTTDFPPAPQGPVKFATKLDEHRRAPYRCTPDDVRAIGEALDYLPTMTERVARIEEIVNRKLRGA